MENRGDAGQVGTLTLSILRPKLQMSSLVRCPDVKEYHSTCPIQTNAKHRVLEESG